MVFEGPYCTQLKSYTVNTVEDIISITDFPYAKFNVMVVMASIDIYMLLTHLCNVYNACCEFF